MSLLKPAVQQELRQLFAALPRPVTLAVFVRGSGSNLPCETCQETRDLAGELASISDGKIVVEIHELEAQPAEATRLGIDDAPAIAVLGGDSGKEDLRIRFFGSPSGYEFATLIEDVRMASTRSIDLAPATRETLSRLNAPLHVRVFVTPTCPYCPRAALLAHRMAMASEWVTADAIDATEFPELARRYHVQGVPRTVINETVHVEGAVPEAMLMAEILPFLESNPRANRGTRTMDA